MRPRLPPLNALRAFEAAARHRNFTKAGQELNVSQSAVSYQVKSLEEHLGLKLFTRTAAGLVLTSAGEEYLSALRYAFDSIAYATARVKSASAMTRIKVSTLPQFAHYWLLPRLPDFSAKFPEINVEVVTTLRTLELDANSVDVAVRWGQEFLGFESHLLFRAVIVPVCSPAFLKAHGPLRKPVDLLELAWLEAYEADEDYRLWFETQGISGMEPKRRTRFDSMFYALQAAAGGMGMAMARLPLAQSELDQGRLVTPIDIRCLSDKGWHMLIPRVAANFKRVSTFARWVLENAETTVREMENDR